MEALTREGIGTEEGIGTVTRFCNEKIMKMRRRREGEKGDERGSTDHLILLLSMESLN